MIEATDDANGRAVEDALVYLSLAERGQGCPDPMFFDGVVAGWPDMLKRLHAACGSPRNDRAYSHLANRLRGISGGSTMKAEIPGFRLGVIGARELDVLSRARLLRKHNFQNSAGLKIPTDTRVVRVRGVNISDDGKSREYGNGFYYQHRSDWYPIHDRQWIGEGRALAESLAFGLSVLQHEAMTRIWNVQIRLAPLTPSLTLYTDPTGITDFFRFRDIPEGKSRRAALAHWVSQHWRKDRHDPEAEIYVREHMRGATQFHWHGMESVIVIPRQDQDRAETSLTRRKRMTPEEARRRRDRVKSR